MKNFDSKKIDKLLEDVIRFTLERQAEIEAEGINHLQYERLQELKTLAEDESARHTIFAKCYNLYRTASTQDKTALQHIYKELQIHCGIKTQDTDPLASFKKNASLARDYIATNRLTKKELAKAQSQLSLEDSLILEDINKFSILRPLKVFILGLFSKPNFSTLEGTINTLNQLKDNVLAKNNNPSIANAPSIESPASQLNLFPTQTPQLNQRLTWEGVYDLILQGQTNLRVDESLKVVNKGYGLSLLEHFILDTIKTQDPDIMRNCLNVVSKAVLFHKQSHILDEMREIAQRNLDKKDGSMNDVSGLITELVVNIEEQAAERSIDFKSAKFIGDSIFGKDSSINIGVKEKKLHTEKMQEGKNTTKTAEMSKS